MFINPEWKDLESLRHTDQLRVVATKSRIAIADAHQYTHDFLKLAMGLRRSDKTNDRMVLMAGSSLLVRTYQKQLKVTPEDQLFNDLASIVGAEVKFM